MKHSFIPFIIIVWLGIMVASGAIKADEPAIAISIAVPVLEPGDSGRMIIVDKNSHFHVILTNTSDKVQRIVTDGNSTGDQALSFEITDDAGKKFTVRKGIQVYSKNMIHWWALQPGESVVLDVWVLSPDWLGGFPHSPDYGVSKTVTMSAIFEVKADGGSQNLWTGRVVSKPEKYVFATR